ncbi:iron complex transport system ATP-binding protein [Streptomyces sp. LamerLS-316]|uniref:ABC transporter ATP-binding protein n=1 Tax=unclassified Streptomyces TaxID=2593676 RepID=UPI000823BEEE|nr:MULTISPECIES: ABC transporter ATP-binding protein [unclassified Streptomyces]MYQ40986.1 ATP-binding cassette domain-containing protein [Streptomyces sp. SID4921]SCK06979.1 iron complex transport system ATP-binding protein [Streptomyces sp. LamerLS-316]
MNGAEASGDGLRATRVSREAGGRIVLDGVSVAPPPGTTVGLLGPNGSGKTTLLRVMAGVLTPGAGVVTLDGRTLAETGRRAVARRVAVVDQHAVTQVDLSVLDVVRLGRIPHRRAWSGPAPGDEDAVREALARTGLADRAGQSWHTLSGGERQRVQIARALAQQPRELLLDEPTNHLDIQHQLELLSLVAELPVTAVIALHDLNLAAMFCDRVTVMKEGRVVAGGTPSEVLTEELIADVYRVRAVVTPEGPDGRPSVRFLPGQAAHGRHERDERAGP